MGFLDLVPFLKDAMDRLIPDKAAAAQAKAALDQMRESENAKQVDDDFQVTIAGLGVVKAEAQGESWLQRNWRPMVAVTFAGLVVAYWFGFTAPNLPVAEVDHLFSIVQVCLGGYTVGRSVEKVATVIAPALRGAGVTGK